MIIVNQDKSVIVNFNNVESIDIVADLDGTGETPYKIYYETASKREKLGEYATEERAKEVFFELNTRISPRRDINNYTERILLLCPTRQISERAYKKCLAKTNMKRIDEKNLLNINENIIYSYMSVEDLLNDRLRGNSFNQVRFIEG